MSNTKRIQKIKTESNILAFRLGETITIYDTLHEAEVAIENKRQYKRLYSLEYIKNDFTSLGFQYDIEYGDHILVNEKLDEDTYYSVTVPYETKNVLINILSNHGVEPSTVCFMVLDTKINKGKTK